jgi:hypothetical protein
VSPIRSFHADRADLGESGDAHALAGHGDQRASLTNSDVVAKLDRPGWVSLACASISGTSATTSASIGAAGCAARAPVSSKTIWSTESARVTKNAGGASTSSVVNNAIWSSSLTKARSDWNEAGSVSLVAANGATAGG